MQIVSALRNASVATALVAASIAFTPAFAQSQAPATTNAHQAQPTAPYSGAGSGDMAAKQAPEGCVSTGGPLKPQTAEQVAQGQAKGPSPYDNKANGAAKNSEATCGSGQ